MFGYTKKKIPATFIPQKKKLRYKSIKQCLSTPSQRLNKLMESSENLNVTPFTGTEHHFFPISYTN